MVEKSGRLTNRTLTVNERILIHMKESPQLRDLMDVPHSLTQHGISEGVGVRVNHVSRAMKALIRDGFVEEKIGRVRGEVRKRKAYALTQHGSSRAEELRDIVLLKNVVLRKKATEKEVSVGKAIQYLGGVSLAAILKKVDSEGVVDLTRKKKSELVSLTRGLPRKGPFYGREGELAILEEWLNSRKEAVLSIAGVKGIGKTTLILNAYEKWRKSMNTLWFTFQDWDTTDTFLEALASFLRELGKPELRNYLNETKKIDMWKVSGLIERGLGEGGTVIFLDDVRIAGRRLESLIAAMIEVVGRSNNAKMIIVQDERKIPDRKSFLAREIVVEIDLMGLDKKSCRKLLSTKMGESEFNKIYRLTEGNPLHIKLIESGKLDELIDTKEYTPEELALIKYLKIVKDIR